jgi:hypothetical protein
MKWSWNSFPRELWRPSNMSNGKPTIQYIHVVPWNIIFIDNFQVDEYNRDLHISRPWSRASLFLVKMSYSNPLFDGKGHRVTPDYAVTGWCKAFRIVDGEHLKMRLNVLRLRQLGICLYCSATRPVFSTPVKKRAPAPLSHRKGCRHPFKIFFFTK